MEEQVNKEQFDIVWLLKYIFSKRKFIGVVVACTTILSIIICLCRPNVYTAKAAILPVAEDQSILSGLGGNVGALASIAGFNLAGRANSNAIITSELYPKIAESVPFLSAMIDVKVPWEGVDTLVSYYEYACADTIMTVGEIIKKYTVGLPGTIKEAISSEKKDTDLNNENNELNYLEINKKRMKVLESMKDMISVEEDPIYGTIDISVEAKTPEQASILTVHALDMIQKTATEHKTRRAKEILKFAEDRYEEATADYEAIFMKYSKYRDTHRNMVEERIGSEYQKLSDKYELSRSILNTISSQVEQARLDIMQNTPVFTVIDPIVLPRKKSGPKMSLHIMSGLLLGIIGALGWLLIQIAWWQVFDEEKYIEIKQLYR